MKEKWWLGVVAVVVAAVVGAGQTLFPLPYVQDFEGPTPPNLPTEWGPGGVPPAQGLWKVVEETDLVGEPPAVRDFPAGKQALYYGVASGGRGTYNDPPNARTLGAVRVGPLGPVTPGATYQVQFDMFRIVESYQGSYDRTRVYAAFQRNDGLWLHPTTGAALTGADGHELNARLLIFARDSSHPSSTAWERVLSDRFKAPPNAWQLFIIFEFDSVDGQGNDYLGWLVDNVWVGQPPTILRTEPLPVGKERERYSRRDFNTWNYDFFFFWPDPNIVPPPPNSHLLSPDYVAQGRVRWDLERGYDVLPPGLTFDKALGRISGTPTQAGTWTIGFILKDESGGEDRKRFDLTILPAIGSGPVRYGPYCWDAIAGPPAVPATPLGRPTGAGPGGWIATPWSTATNPPATERGLWHITDDTVVPGVDGRVAYYGRSNDNPPETPGTPGSYNYSTGARTWGYLTSGPITLEKGDVGKLVGVGFTHYRDVESFEKGAFDQTFVEISFDNKTWTRIWYKDSRDPSERQWQTVLAVSKDPIPASATRLWVRFGFDSVDATNNDFDRSTPVLRPVVGWIIDCVHVRVMEPQLAISISCPLPDGVRGTAYSVTLKAVGGAQPYTWSVQGLPEGLTLNPTTGVISGVPTRAGDYSLTITVRDANGVTDEKTRCMLRIAAVPGTVSLFTETFDNCPVDEAKWEQPTGLWKCVNTVIWNGTDLLPAAPTGSVPVKEGAAYYGRTEVVPPTYGGQVPTVLYNYDLKGPDGKSVPTMGYLTSKPFALSGAKYVQITFWYWREVEFYSAGSFDKTYLQVRFENGPWQTVWYLDSKTPSEKAWTKVEGPAHPTLGIQGIEVPTGATTMQIRFVFDTVDKHNNGFTGWIVDNITVTAASAGAPLPWLSAVMPADVREIERPSVLSVFNYPNPVRDVHTTTFAVRGVEAEAIRVEVFDLSGRLVYTAEVAGCELVWHTQDQLGRYLANGVYLYRVHAKVAGTWISSELQKLAIYR